VNWYRSEHVPTPPTHTIKICWIKVDLQTEEDESLDHVSKHDQLPSSAKMSGKQHGLPVRLRRAAAITSLVLLCLHTSSSQFITTRRSSHRVPLRHLSMSEPYDSPFSRQSPPSLITLAGRPQHNPFVNRVHFANSNQFGAIGSARQPARRDIIFPTSNELIDNEPPISAQESADRSGLMPFQQIKFISPKQELAQTRWWYDAPVTFSAKGMEHLYLLNRYIMEWIQPTVSFDHHD
jgi:hypothetical protein